MWSHRTHIVYGDSVPFSRVVLELFYDGRTRYDKRAKNGMTVANRLVVYTPVR